MRECFVCDSFLRFVFQDSSKTSRKVSDKWVQTRGYQACVVYMPIPLRVCLAGAPTNYKAFLLDYRKPTKLPHTIIDNKYIKCL